ncbi:hypothetical protein D3869_01565 [Azospirillum brasilense]|uniref:Uncharacterized protein n=1 Tax=Azospirillum brasilense TaxID=192 RepID=A0A4D8R020_AZOBR|nr:hypothetical protein [Azospirillum brasilense]QCO14023.1 hypothetical protein D3869_01565 [Azospirillum brasilense]
MAYAPKDLSVLVYANGFTLWHYTTQHDLTRVDEPGYFDGAADLVHVGDQITINAGGRNTFRFVEAVDSRAGTVRIGRPEA